MSVEPHRIRALKAREQELFSRQEDVKAHARTSAQAAFFEAASLSVRNPREEARQQAAMLEDLRVSAAVLLQVRREALRDLYAKERAEWAQALRERGLAMDVRTE